MTRHIHIVGAGMAGLSTALQLSLMGEKVSLYEAAPYAGGRCRSYYDRELDCRIDNGNHLVLSGNVAIEDYLYLTQATDSMGGPDAPIFPFMDLQTNERWTIRMNEGRMPWWLLHPKRRVPGTGLADYFSILKILMADPEDTVAALLRTDTTLYRRFWEPLAVAALNTEPENASADLLASLFQQSFGAGGKACKPLIPKIGLSETFVLPCLNTLRQHDVDVKFGHRLRSLKIAATDTGLPTVRSLDFGEDAFVELTDSDWVVLAVPPWVAKELIPEIVAPTAFRAITNAHFRVEAPTNQAGFTGLVGGLAEWVFVKQGLVSVTISAADRYKEQRQEDWAAHIWRDLANLFDLDPANIPPWRIVREKRATFAATPEQNLLRPRSYTGWQNLALAGDWTATGLPSTIEGAIRSGVKAAQVVMRWKE